MTAKADCRRVGQCYNPECNNSADWSGDVRKAYCSWECAVDARTETLAGPEENE